MHNILKIKQVCQLNYFNISLLFISFLQLKDHFASYHPGIPFDLKAMRKAPTPTKPTPAKIPPIKIKLEDGRAVTASSGDGQEGGSGDGPEVVSCGEDSSVDADLIELVNASVAARGDGVKPFGCIQCQYTARDVWHLRRHIADVHLKRRNHRCKV